MGRSADATSTPRRSGAHHGTATDGDSDRKRIRDERFETPPYLLVLRSTRVVFGVFCPALPRTANHFSRAINHGVPGTVSFRVCGGAVRCWCIC
jgi:hypothetical protein